MVKKSNKRRMNEWHESGRSFPEGVKFYVNGKKLPIKDDFWVDDIADVFVSECKRTRGLEDWIRDYVNSLGDSDFDNGGMMPIDEVCYWFAKELQYYFDDCDDGEFYVDGSEITRCNNGVRVEIFDGEEVTESMHKTRRTAKRPVREGFALDQSELIEDMYHAKQQCEEILEKLNGFINDLEYEDVNVYSASIAKSIYRESSNTATSLENADISLSELIKIYNREKVKEITTYKQLH